MSRSGLSRPLKFGVVVHGGAWDIPDDDKQAHLDGVREACAAAIEILRKGGSALDAAETCVRRLEDDPTFDAGKGSFLNQAGEVEMDAVMGTHDWRVGSVSAVQNVKNPISLAREILNSPHTLLSGSGAKEFAVEKGLEIVSTEDLLVGRELDRLKQLQSDQSFHPKDSFTASSSSSSASKPTKGQGMGTVGCVCLDHTGLIVVAVSTGGTPFKRSGRVGDTPIWGAGGYAEEPYGGVAATGYGEDLYRSMICRTYAEVVKYGPEAFRRHSKIKPVLARPSDSDSFFPVFVGAPATPLEVTPAETTEEEDLVDPQKGVEETIRFLSDSVKGRGGLIALNKHGVGIAFNTPRMAYAFHTDAQAEMVVGIDPSSSPGSSP